MGWTETTAACLLVSVSRKDAKTRTGLSNRRAADYPARSAFHFHRRLRRQRAKASWHRPRRVFASSREPLIPFGTNPPIEPDKSPQTVRHDGRNPSRPQIIWSRGSERECHGCKRLLEGTDRARGGVDPRRYLCRDQIGRPDHLPT